MNRETVIVWGMAEPIPNWLTSHTPEQTRRASGNAPAEAAWAVEIMADPHVVSDAIHADRRNDVRYVSLSGTLTPSDVIAVLNRLREDWTPWNGAPPRDWYEAHQRAMSVVLTALIAYVDGDPSDYRMGDDHAAQVAFSRAWAEAQLLPITVDVRGCAAWPEMGGRYCHDEAAHERLLAEWPARNREAIIATSHTHEVPA